MVVEQKPNPGLRWIAAVELTEPCDEIRSGMALADDLGDAAGVEIETSQQPSLPQSRDRGVPRSSVSGANEAGFASESDAAWND